VIVLNWDRKPEVSVDLSSVGLQPGREFEVRDAQDLFGRPVVAARYMGAPVVIPMTGRASLTAIGNVPAAVPHTAPQFAVFVVAPTSWAVPR
jgi:hypothetical protein